MRIYVKYIFKKISKKVKTTFNSKKFVHYIFESPESDGATAGGAAALDASIVGCR